MKVSLQPFFFSMSTVYVHSKNSFLRVYLKWEKMASCIVGSDSPSHQPNFLCKGKCAYKYILIICIVFLVYGFDALPECVFEGEYEVGDECY